MARDCLLEMVIIGNDSVNCVFYPASDDQTIQCPQFDPIDLLVNSDFLKNIKVDFLACRVGKIQKIIPNGWISLNSYSHLLLL